VKGRAALPSIGKGPIPEDRELPKKSLVDPHRHMFPARAYANQHSDVLQAASAIE